MRTRPAQNDSSSDNDPRQANVQAAAALAMAARGQLARGRPGGGPPPIKPRCSANSAAKVLGPLLHRPPSGMVAAGGRMAPPGPSLPAGSAVNGIWHHPRPRRRRPCDAWALKLTHGCVSVLLPGPHQPGAEERGRGRRPPLVRPSLTAACRSTPGKKVPGLYVTFSTLILILTSFYNIAQLL